MAYTTSGLPSTPQRKSKQRTIAGVKYVARVTYHYGQVSGFYLFKGRVKTFHNGTGFENPFSIDEALQWAINNM